MLHITDNYYAQANNYGYTVVRNTGRKDKKNNEDIYITLGYVGSLKEVLELTLKDSVQRKISGAEIELGDALQYVKEQTNRVMKAMEGIKV